MSVAYGLRCFFLSLGCVLATGCANSTEPDTVTLPLTQVDGRTLPTVLPAETGTVQVVGGRLTGSSSGPRCRWHIVFEPGGESSDFIAVPCVLNEGDVLNLTFDAGPTAAEHTFRFGQ